MSRLQISLPVLALLFLCGCSKSGDDLSSPASAGSTTANSASTADSEPAASKASGAKPAGATSAPVSNATAKPAASAPAKAAVVTASSPSSNNSIPKNLLGKWDGMEANTDNNNSKSPGAQLVNAFASMTTPKLELNSDGTYRLTVFFVSFDGRYTVQGEKLELKPEKLMGQTEDQLKQFEKQSPQSQQMGHLDGAFKELTANVVKGGTELTLHWPGFAPGPQPGQQGPQSFVFHKAAAEIPRKSTVTAAEAALVGKWSVNVDLSKTIAKQNQSPAMMDMAKSMMKGMALELRKDNTFDMNVGMDVEGKWSLSGKTVSLQVDLGGMSGGKPETLAVSGDGKTLTAENSVNGQMSFTKE